MSRAWDSYSGARQSVSTSAKIHLNGLVDHDRISTLTHGPLIRRGRFSGFGLKASATAGHSDCVRTCARWKPAAISLNV